MMTLVADKDTCKGCACVLPQTCILKMVETKTIAISEDRYKDDEELREAVQSVIRACPLGSVELQTCGV